MPLEPPDEDSIADFIATWNLNEDAQTKLMSITAEAQHIVLRDFAPPDGAAECNGKFITFANSVNNAHKRNPGKGAHSSAASVSEDALVEFCDQWALNEDAQQKLLTLSPNVLEIVVSSFAPPPDMAEVSGKLIMFASSIEKTHRGQPPQQTKGKPVAAGFKGFVGGKGKAGRDPAADFAAHWGLNEDAQTKLYSLSPPLQSRVMSEFAPPPGMSEYNGKFIAFAASCEKAHGGAAQHWAPQAPAQSWGPQAAGGRMQQELAGFVAHWGLNEDASTKLYSLSPHVQQIVLRDFAPPPGVQEVNGKFIKFAASIANAHPQPHGQPISPLGKGAPVARIAPAQAWASPAPAKGKKGLAGGKGAGGGSNAHACQNFIAHWGLNDDAATKLYSLAPAVQQQVMNSFNPPPGMSEYNGKFIKFAASMQSGPRADQAIPAAAPSHNDSVSGFLQHWGLNGDAQAKMWSLPQEVQLAVMDGFAPPPQLGDYNGKFISFAVSVAKAQAGQWVPQAGGVKRPAPQMHSQVWGPADQVAKRPRVPQSTPPWRAAAAPDLDAFVAQWGLNEDAIAKLQQLSPGALTTVLNEFNPQGTPNAGKGGWSGKLIVFAGQIQRAHPA